MVQQDGGVIDGAMAPNAPTWLRAWVQNNSGRSLLLPYREENINSLGAAVQHKFSRTLLVPSREEKISGPGAAVRKGVGTSPKMREPVKLRSHLESYHILEKVNKTKRWIPIICCLILHCY